MWRNEHCEVEGIILEGFAAGGEATSIRVPTFGVILDIGISIPQTITHRYHSLLLSHGHSDHAGALIYMLGQRGMRKLPPIDIYLPEALVDPVKRLIAIWEEIEGYERAANFFPMRPGDLRTLQSGQRVVALQSVHRISSLAYVLGRGESIEGFEPRLCVTGDTRIEFVRENPLAQRSDVLIHELTSWNEERDVEETRRRGHTHIEEILDSADCFREVKKLVLVHRSARHSRRYAIEQVQERFPDELREKTVVFG